MMNSKHTTGTPANSTAAMKRKPNYDKFPAIQATGKIACGWNELNTSLEKIFRGEGVRTAAMECYIGSAIDEMMAHIRIGGVQVIDTRKMFKQEAEIVRMTSRHMTDDVLFGYVTDLKMEDFIDWDKVAAMRSELDGAQGKVLVVGCGASLVAPQSQCLLYADMARWEIQMRFRRREFDGLGVKNRNEATSLQHKRAYFIDWRVCDELKRRIIGKVDYWIDGNDCQTPKMISAATFAEGLARAARSPFRVVPFFDPAPWGGQWMKEVCDLDRSKENFGWCFDCVPEENSLLLEVEGVTFEMPSINLVFSHPEELLGAAVAARFGYEFPIRFDFLDTMGGGNLSLQVHPTTQYIRERFGMQYTQDESYYMLDAGEGATVYLGLRTGIDREAMLADLRRAQAGEIVFDAEKYVNKLPAKKHDHFLIPGGTIHCSGSNALVLEISSTPNIFTFKLWDWQRLGLDGKPRPINIGHGSHVIDWRRDTEYVKKYLANVVEPVAEGDGWREERTGLHANEFIETRRHWFDKPVEHDTEGSVNVLNLIEGDACVVESPDGQFEPYTVHYAETFIIPECVGRYRIRPLNGQSCATIKARVRV